MRRTGKIPQHRHAQQFGSMVELRRMADAGPRRGLVNYAHQDDYYVIGLVESGLGRGFIDFQQVDVTVGDLFVVQPGQVHRFVDSNAVDGWLLIAGGELVGDADKAVFDEFALYGSSLKVDDWRREELGQIAELLDMRLCRLEETLLPTTMKLAETFIGIVAEVVQSASLNRPKHSRRRIEIVMAFKRLLSEHLKSSRRASFYAGRLNVSTVYLNEVVKDVTGLSTSDCVKNETILQAKRLLVNTNLSVKEIAYSLGIDDCAYFSRLFARTVGESPSEFRQRYLD